MKHICHSTILTLKNETGTNTRLKTMEAKHDNRNRFVLAAKFKTNSENVFSKQFLKNQINKTSKRENNPRKKTH